MDANAVVTDGEITAAVARAAWRHARSEFHADIGAVMETIAADVPLTYAVPYTRPDGSVAIAVGTTREHAIAHYEGVYGAIHVRDWEPFLELRKSWYVFFEGVVSYLDHATRLDSKGHSIVFFAMTEGEGIEGEMVWNRFPTIDGYRPKLGEDAGRDDARSLPLSKVGSRTLHSMYVAALKNGDPGRVLDLMVEQPQGAIRNYVDEAPRFIHLDGRDAMHRHLAQFAERYVVEAIEVMSLMANDWYIFSELHWAVRERAGGQRALRMHTAEFLPLDHTGKIVARVGYGTPQV